MGYTLIIRTFDDNPLIKGEFYFSGKYYKEIVEHFNDITKIELRDIESAIVIFAKKEDYKKSAININLKSFNIGSGSIKISFVKEGSLRLTTNEIRKRLYIALNRKKILKNVSFLPLCCLLNGEIAKEVKKQKSFEISDLIDKLNNFKKNNDWLKIIKEVEPLDKISEKNDIWEDDELLNIVSFATSKLAEMDNISLKNRKNKHYNNEYLKTKKNYRMKTELLRKRCIELNPNSATYFSNLGYLYYNNVSELKIRKRKDGNILSEIKNAIDVIDKALIINPQRITDLYRKGKLLVFAKPEQISFGKHEFEKREELASESIDEGIKCFKNAVHIWENMDETESKEKKRLKKYYVKSLYNLGKTYYNFIINNWDTSVFLLPFDNKIHSNIIVNYKPMDVENINNAIKYFEKCVLADNNITNNTNNSLNRARINNFIDGVDKLYSIGKSFLLKSWIISGYGQLKNDEMLDNINLAEKYLLEAINLNYPNDKIKKKKIFIRERLARLLIMKSDYKGAIKIIESNSKEELEKLEPYVLNTLSVALILDNNYKNAYSFLEISSKNRGNLYAWETFFIHSCGYYREGNIELSEKYILKAEIEAKNKNKNIADSYFLLKALLEEEKKNMIKMKEFLEKAKEINPYRLATISKISSMH